MAKRSRCCAQQCCDLLRSNVAIIWPELYSTDRKHWAYAILSSLCGGGGGGGGRRGERGGGGLETNVFSQRPVLSLLGDSNEPTREENRLTMDDRAARLKARRFHVEEWDRA